MIDKIASRPILSVLLLTLLSLYLFFFQLGGMALTDPDETFYAQTAKEMLSRGEWVTPYLYGNAQFEKPILYYWLIEASYRAFGVNEFAARFPSAGAALVGVIALYFLGSILFNKRVGLLAALMLAVSVEYIILARGCLTDMVLAVLMLLTFTFFIYGIKRGRAYFYLLSAAMLGLATLTKGPVAVFLSGAIMFIYIIVTRQWDKFRRMPFIPAAATFLVVTLPWYVIIYKIHGQAFIDAFFGFHNVNRFLEAEHKIGSQIYFNIPVVFGGFFPWSIFLPVGFWHIFKSMRLSSEGDSMKFISIWFVVIFVFFTISSTKLATYIFPLFPALALISALVWDDFLKGEGAPSWIRNGTRFSYYFFIAASVIAAVIVPIALNIKYPFLVKGLAISLSFLVFGFFLSYSAFGRRKYEAAFFLLIYAVFIFLYPLERLVLPEVERHETSIIIAEELLKHSAPDEKVGSESNYLAGLAFYADKVPVDIDKYDNLVKFLASEKRVWCVLKEKNHRQLYELDTKPYYTRPSYMVYRLGKKCIVTNLPPRDGKYLVKRERTDGKI